MADDRCDLLCLDLVRAEPLRRDRLVRRAKLLSWLSLAWMTIEGAVAVTAGLVAGSVALVGFGIDSAIEGLASVIVIWRFTGSRTFSETAEQRAQKLVAVSFFLLAPYIAQDAARPGPSAIGCGPFSEMVFPSWSNTIWPLSRARVFPSGNA